MERLRELSFVGQRAERLEKRRETAQERERVKKSSGVGVGVVDEEKERVAGEKRRKREEALRRRREKKDWAEEQVRLGKSENFCR